MIVLIKLADGTEIVGEHIGETPRFVTVQDPLMINYRLLPHQAMPTVSMSRYMPFASEHIFNFEKVDIKHQVDPRPALAHYYKYSIKNYREQVDANIDQQMQDAVPAVQEDIDALKQQMYANFLQDVEIEGPMN